MKDIVIIDHEPLTVRKKEAWHIEELRQAGLNVCFWDVSGYIHPGMSIADTLCEDFVVSLSSYNMVEERLALMDICHCYTIRIELYASIYMDRSSIRGWR